METMVSRTKSQRSANYSRRKRYGLEESDRVKKIIKQLIICAAIFVIYLTMKNVNSPYTKILTDKTSETLRNDTNVSSAVLGVKEFFSSLNITNEKLKSVFNNQITEVNGNETSIIPADIKNKIFDANLIKDKGFALPVNGVITSVFGFRVNPITKVNEFHEGVDIDAKIGEDIKATMDGIVLEARNNQSLGNYVKLKHSDDITSIYAHSSSLMVKEGQLVSKGEVIAKAGSTGLSEGPHLHFELRKGDKIINPLSILNFNTK